MKILIASEYFTEIGGAEQYLFALTEELEKLGHRIAVVCGKKMGNETAVESPKQHYVENAFSFKGGKGGRIAAQIREVVNRIDPDLIYINEVHNPYAIRLLASMKPVVRFFHGCKISCPSGARTLFRSRRPCDDPLSLNCMVRAYTERCMPRNLLTSARLMKIGFGNLEANQGIKRILVASHYMKHMLINNGFPEKHITVLPYFAETPVLPSPDKNGSPPVIFCAARMEPLKGIAEFIEALAIIPSEWQCIIAGTGSALDDFKETAIRHNLQDRIQFVGWISNKDIGQYYDRASIVAVPSLWPEPFGIVGIEAMSYAKPVVAFDVGGIREWLDHEKTGYLVKWRDVQNFARMIKTLLDDPALRQRMGKEARRQFLEKFTKEIYFSKLMKIFDEAINE